MATTDEIFDYVMNNPYNTNPNQLRTMLDSVGSSGGGGSVICELTFSSSSGVASTEMTAGELYSAVQEGKTIIFHLLTDAAEPMHAYYYIIAAGLNFGNYYFSCTNGTVMTFSANSPDAHATCRME